jgi:hypothetical protein
MTNPTTRTLGRDDWMTPPEVFEPLHTFANTDTRYWADHVASSPHCHQVVFLRPRVRFDLPGGSGVRTGAPKGSALIVYRDRERAGKWPLHCYADWTADFWVQSSGLAQLAEDIRRDR